MPLAAITARFPVLMPSVIGIVALLMTPTPARTDQCLSTLYATPQRAVRQNSFAPDEVIYFYLYCDRFEQTEHALAIDWVAPTGRVLGQTVDAFTTDSAHGVFQKVYAVKLPRRGYVSQILTGVRYGDELYGTWTYRVHLNGVLLDKDHFTIR
ncbi:hypothetical protein [Desulfogranum mediterraneum]|uniref:hypothetical protein n=1 Tax=Desulfogranum mediterraneum TaxID=160661 RepID=UPI0004164943|nr:hypothetical protein [Desulfogranum mediterraneum]